MGASGPRGAAGDVPLDEARRQQPDSREVLKIATTGPVVPSWQVPTVDWLAGLPRDPALLRERLYVDSADRGRSTDGEVLVYVADVLRSGIVPPDLRVALYELLITVPGVEVTEADAELFGRSGVALGRVELFGGDRQEIVIDPDTGDYLGDRYVSPDGTISYGSVTTAIVDAVPADVVAAADVMTCATQPDGATSCERGDLSLPTPDGPVTIHVSGPIAAGRGPTVVLCAPPSPRSAAAWLPGSSPGCSSRPCRPSPACGWGCPHPPSSSATGSPR